MPGTLVQIMSRRGFQMSVAADAPSALLEAVETQATALLIVEPQHQPQGRELIDTARRYFPRLAMWQVTDHQGQPNLSAISDLPSSVQPPAADPSTASSARTPEDAQRQPEEILPANPPRLFAEGEPGPIVTKDELAMLIGAQPQPLPPLPPTPPRRAAE
ncbi:MAG: hypothetical protein AAGI68_02245 [Planctomycetota bacterium]